MRQRNGVFAALLLAAVLSVEPWHVALLGQNSAAGVPRYEVDPSWPPRLPNNWVMGVPTWVAVDRVNMVASPVVPSWAPKPQHHSVPVERMPHVAFAPAETEGRATGGTP